MILGCYFFFSEVQDRVMLTGRHMVRDVSCKNCDAKLGWIYEFATEENQRYKEGRVILERALVTESDGIDEHMGDDWSNELVDGVGIYSAFLVHTALQKPSCVEWSEFKNRVQIICVDTSFLPD